MREPLQGTRQAIAVRPGTREDLELLVKLWVDLVLFHRRLDPSVPAPVPREALARELERVLASPRGCVLVGLCEGQPSGFALAQVESSAASGEPRGRIDELFVAEEARGRGLGRALVDAFAPFFREAGVSRVSVRIEAANRAALAFWQKRGFAPRAHVLERTISANLPRR